MTQFGLISQRLLDISMAYQILADCRRVPYRRLVVGPEFDDISKALSLIDKTGEGLNLTIATTIIHHYHLPLQSLPPPRPGGPLTMHLNKTFRNSCHTKVVAHQAR
jgi:hypothetical protein